MNNPLALKTALGKRKQSNNGTASAQFKKPRQETVSKLKTGARNALPNGEEVKGFVFVRGAPTSRQRGEGMHDVFFETSKPTLSSTAPVTLSPSSNPTERPLSSTSRLPAQVQLIYDEQRIDDDIRQMDEEASQLRDVSLTHARRASAFNIELPSSTSKHSPKRVTKFKDTIQPLPQVETPLNRRNKEYRLKERRTTRSKRTNSSIGTNGVITPPHPTIPTANFHKHIDVDLPDALRFRHLFVWCATRGTSQLSRRKTLAGPSSAPPLPPLSQQGRKALQNFQNSIIQLFAEAKFETPVTTGERETKKRSHNMRENEQNIKNRRREDKFLKDIERAKAEDAAWVELIRSYNTRQQSTVTNVEASSQAHAQKKSANQKEKASDSLRDRELGPRWHSAILSARKACLVISPHPHDITNSPLSSRMKDVEFQVDQLQGNIHISSQLALRSSIDLDKRFSRLSSALRFTTRPPLGSTKPDPRDVLRAIAHTDINRLQRTTETARPKLREESASRNR